jgi:hypothetical protein
MYPIAWERLAWSYLHTTLPNKHPSAGDMLGHDHKHGHKLSQVPLSAWLRRRVSLSTSPALNTDTDACHRDAMPHTSSLQCTAPMKATCLHARPMRDANLQAPIGVQDSQLQYHWPVIIQASHPLSHIIPCVTHISLPLTHHSRCRMPHSSQPTAHSHNRKASTPRKHVLDACHTFDKDV